MSDVISGNDPEHCIHLFNVLCRKHGLLVCFDGSVGKVQIYQKEGARYRVLKRQNRIFSIFDPDKDGRDYEENAKRWVEAADILSRQLKDRGIQIRILSNDQCVFTRVIEKAFVPFNDVVDLVRSGRITAAYGAEQLGMTEEGFIEALEQAGVQIAEAD
jgi:hypothetical protein